MTTTPRIAIPTEKGLLRTIADRKRVVFGSVAAFLAFGMALNTFMPPVYRATVRVEFPSSTNDRSPWTGQPVPAGNFQSENAALFTSAELITNRVLLGRLAGDLIRSEPAILAESNATKRSESGLRWPRVPIARAASVTATNARVQYDPIAVGERVERLERSVTVVPVADTRLVDIRVEDGDPVMARETADRLARMFVDWQQQRTASFDRSGLTFVVDEIARLKSRIEETSAELSRLGGVSTRTEMSRVRKPADVSGLRRDLSKAELELADAAATYRNSHPRLQALKSEVRALRNQLAQQSRVATYEMRPTQTVVRSSSPRRTVLENDLAVDEALYARLQSRAREMGLERQMAMPAVAVVEPATVEPDPIRPRPLLNLAVCLLAGLFVGIGIALVKGSLSRTIRNAFDAEELTGLRVLAVIPKHA